MLEIIAFLAVNHPGRDMDPIEHDFGPQDRGADLVNGLEITFLSVVHDVL